MTAPTPFTRLLIANRGEIAVRVIRTARAMGLSTVAVHSEADRDALHVRLADAAVCIGGPAPADSYLRIDRIIDAARATGAGAIHPGYGFLAENPGLPEACAEAGIVFVGPSARAIASMGDKAGAKALMRDAGVPVVPGHDGEDQSSEALTREAAAVGFPLMIKAVAGGGGRGMRLVESAEGFADALASAASEAKAAFGDGRVLLERAVMTPRHVEIQVMADRHGNVVHLGERDCSVQRRHQKLIEEAPSPAVDAALRARMGEASVAAARAIGYEGAGTFEYLLDADGAFYFMEMNTRLQVEHPVTEAVTGLDLVELQLRVAMGEALPIRQEDVRITGHAIEARLCAEDAEAGFMPQSGRLALWRPAGGLRADHGLSDGAEIPPFYDSMIAKLIAHGPDRDAARRRLIAGMEGTAALGVRTNRAYLAAALGHPVFAAGQATTGFIGTHGADLSAPEGAEARAAMRAAALLRAGPRARLSHGYAAPLRLVRDGREYGPRVASGPRGAMRVEMEGEAPLSLRVLGKDGPRVTYEEDGLRRAALLLAEDGAVEIQEDALSGGLSFDYRDLSFAPLLSAEAAGSDGKLRAALNGAVVRVAAAEGETVEAGAVLVVLEAMKMEHAHTAPVAGKVAAVHVAEGAQAAAGAVLVEIEAG
ncbi:acetyl-CoA carboxylase biotin carboxylase subunit [Rhodovulum sp. DZ06]|uniref:acetyl/propionyl/methylcrotonyl-CoA carboxylase subunit alpha n=1 Tax=Rhodovulum sp. DZ06 TaxID=3425126 RepID=UPI003D341ACE